MPQDTKEIIQFKHVDHEQVAEKQQTALRAKFEVEKRKRKRAQSISEYQTEVETELDVEEKAAEIKNQVQTAKNSHEAQQHRAATALKAEM